MPVSPEFRLALSSNRRTCSFCRLSGSTMENQHR